MRSPASSQNQERGAVVTMLPGDHLQLLYHFQLFRDFAQGDTPWFHDIYEFNLGDDEERRWLRAWFVPISAVFALGSWLFGIAAGYNLTLFVCLWLSYLFTWLLLRRLGADAVTAGAAALMAIVFPYRWVAALGGAPAGFAAMYVPLLWWSLDGVLREPRWRYALAHALAWVLLAFGDMQTLYFATALVPAMVLTAMSRPGWRLRPPRLLVGLIGWATGIGYIYAALRGLRGSTLERARPEIDIALSSPRAADLFAWFRVDTGAHGFFGVTLALFLIAGTVWAWPRLRGQRLVVALLLAGLLVGTMVALGTHGPVLWKGDFETLRPVHLARKLLPGFDRVRQPTKLYIVYPTILAVLAALLAMRLPRRLAICALALVVLESSLQVRASLCRLDDEPAYGLAKRIAGDRPVLVLPLHGGDDATTSEALHHALQHRLRLVNGYSPAVPLAWQRQAYEPARAAVLAGRVPRLGAAPAAVLLHEDLVRPGADPYAADWLRDRLDEDCGLTLVAWTNGVGVYEVVDPDCVSTAAANVTAIPGRVFEVEGLLSFDGSVHLHNDVTAGAGRYMDMRQTGTRIALPPVPGQLHLRARGEGTLQLGATTQTVARAAGWTWLRGAVDGEDDAVRLLGGEAQLDALFVVPAAWTAEDLDWPAHEWFHRADFQKQGGGLLLAPGETTSVYPSLSGPHLPVPPGRYRFEVEFLSAAAPGTRLGEWRFATDGSPWRTWPLIQGGDNAVEIDVPDNRPLRCTFHYAGTAPLRVLHLRLGSGD